MTNFEPLFLISAEKFPSCLGDLACCSLCLLLSGSTLFSAFALAVYTLARPRSQKNKPSCLCRKDCKLKRRERCSRRVSQAGPSQPQLSPLLPAIQPAPMRVITSSSGCGHRQQMPSAGAGIQVLQVRTLPGNGIAPGVTGSRYLPATWRGFPARPE